MTTMSLVAQQTGGNVTFLISLVLMVAIFYFLLIRPQQRRMRQQRELLGSLDVGDEVITVGGLYGRILEMDEESVTLDAGAGTRLRYAKQAVAKKYVEDDEEETGEES